MNWWIFFSSCTHLSLLKHFSWILYAVQSYQLWYFLMEFLYFASDCSGMYIFSNSRLPCKRSWSKATAILLFCRFVRNHTLLFGCLVVLEVSLLRFLTIFVWKRMPPLNPDFYTRFGNIANFLASLLLANMSSYSKPGMGIELQLIGGNPELVLDPELDLRY